MYACTSVHREALESKPTENCFNTKKRDEPLDGLQY